MITSLDRIALTPVNPADFVSKFVFEHFARQILPQWAEFCCHIRISEFAAGERLFAQEEAHRFIYVVRHGLLKNEYLRPDGEIWIKSFCQERQFIGSLAALEPGGVSSFSVTATENTVVERIDFSVLEHFAQQNIIWANMLRRAIWAFGAMKEKREHDLLVLRPEARYRQFIAENADLEQRIAQKDLAAYLGMTPVGLNRIVKRVRGSRNKPRNS